MTFLRKHIVSMSLLGLQCCAPIAAQTPGDKLVPEYNVKQFAQAAAFDNVRRSTNFVAAALQLKDSLAAYCDPATSATQASAEVQSKWREAQMAWDQLAALNVGPLVMRAAMGRGIDFMPARRDMLDRAIASAPQSQRDLERIGTPALGFNALELLLWPTAPAAGSPQCSYAALAAASIASEADTLGHQFANEAALALDDNKARGRLIEVINQWVAGVEQLRWAFMRKPLEVASARNQAPQYPRQLSGQTMSAWRSRWSTLKSFAVQPGRPLPEGGQPDGPISLEAWLRARGKLAPLADELAAATQRVDASMDKAQPQTPASVMAAATALGSLGKLVHDKVAPALGVQMGFSDADGD